MSSQHVRKSQQDLLWEEMERALAIAPGGFWEMQRRRYPQLAVYLDCKKRTIFLDAATVAFFRSISMYYNGVNTPRL